MNKRHMMLVLLAWAGVGCQTLRPFDGYIGAQVVQQEAHQGLTLQYTRLKTQAEPSLKKIETYCAKQLAGRATSTPKVAVLHVREYKKQIPMMVAVHEANAHWSGGYGGSIAEKGVPSTDAGRQYDLRNVENARALDIVETQYTCTP